MMKYLLVFLILLISVESIFSQENVLISYRFDQEQELNDWTIEGAGKAYIEHGKLILEPLFFQLMDSLMRCGKISLTNNQEEYVPYLYPAMKSKYGDTYIKYYCHIDKGKEKFLGGHFNYWNNKYELPNNFVIEFDFRTLSPAPLHMLMFCASGLNNENIFEPQLAKRYGKSTEVMHELSMYRLSYMSGSRGTANLRRAPGRMLVAQGTDFASNDSINCHHYRIERIRGVLKYIVDNQEILSYKDDFPLEGKNWGFRIMVCAKGEYDNIVIKKLDNY